MTIDAPARDRYPLSPMQQGMLFHHLSSSDAGVDLEQIVCSLDEALDVEAFRGAWDALAAAHEVFRTAFAWDGIPEPQQEVLEGVSVPFEVLDWRGRSEADAEVAFDELLIEDRNRGLELTSAPVMRVTLVRLGEASYRCVWSFHHMLIDGRVYAELLRELFEAYDAVRAGREPCVRVAPALPRVHRVDRAARAAGRRGVLARCACGLRLADAAARRFGTRRGRRLRAPQRRGPARPRRGRDRRSAHAGRR